MITINSNHFLYLKEFHILVRYKDRSIANEYNYNAIIMSVSNKISI